MGINFEQCKPDLKKVFSRSFFDLVATILFLTALLNMPFANVNAILQALPLAVTIAASIFLKETFGRKRAFAWHHHQRTALFNGHISGALNQVITGAGSDCRERAR